MMALPDHSPQRPYVGPGSPIRPFSNGPSDPHLPPPFGPRQMLPPSPQHFQQRYPQPAPLPPSAAASFAQHNEMRPLPPAPKRPGSSMSISSMLGSESEKPGREAALNVSQQQPMHRPSTSAPFMSAVMSPPQYPSRPSNGEYAYQARSQTPDRTGSQNSFGTRQYRSSSGSMMPRPGPFDDRMNGLGSRTPSASTGPSAAPGNQGDAAAERARRTSISGILQGPPQNPPNQSLRVSPGATPTTQSPWGDHATANGDRVAQRGANGFSGSDRAPVAPPESSRSDTRSNGAVGSYDTRPPGFGAPRQSPYPPPGREAQPDRAPSQPLSPLNRRSVLEGPPNRGIGGLLNGPSAGPDSGHHESHVMDRQDSTQSQNDRPMISDRFERSRPRFFSPFSSSIGQQVSSTASAPPEDQNRKGSDESSQHRAILGLALESKRGRYSPLPQAVQGAQAQTPVPDAGIKSEHGRVFSGIGSGIGTSLSGLTPAPPGLSASPFKRDEGLPRLSEDNLMKISRSTPGTNKRPRKFKDDDVRASSEVGEARGPLGASRGKRGKHHHHHHHYKVDKVDLDDPNNPLTLQRRNTPLSNLHNIRQAATPTPGPNGPGHHHHHHHRHHHHHSDKISNPPPHPTSVQRQTVNINPVLEAASRFPRRHLGFFKYSPTTSTQTDPSAPTTKLNVSIRPNRFPVFDGPGHINCTYTIHVPQIWLGEAQSEAIRAQRFLWGSGVYTDDSDPVAAAMHAGFLKAGWSEHVDVAQLEELGKIYDSVIDGGQENVPASGPVVPEPGKDARITLLVVPTLEQYPGTGRFGVRSRDWGNEAEHDGMSFVVLNVKFVDAGRWTERTGQERRKRWREEMKERDEGWAMALRTKAPDSGKKSGVVGSDTSRAGTKEGKRKEKEK